MFVCERLIVLYTAEILFCILYNYDFCIVYCIVYCIVGYNILIEVCVNGRVCMLGVVWRGVYQASQLVVPDAIKSIVSMAD